MIIDAQAHYMPPTVAEKTAFFKVGWSDVDRQLRAMDQAGIDCAVLIYPTSDAHLAMGGWMPLCEIYNREIAAVVNKYPQRFIGGGIIPADKPEAISSELVRMRELGLRVISLASSYDGCYLDDARFIPVFEFARKNKMPIHVHPQIIKPIGEERVRDPLLSPVLEYVMDVSMCVGKLLMSDVFLKFPEVNFIFAHYGGVLPIVKERFDTTYQMLRRREYVKDLKKLPSEYFANLYLDTSGSKSVATLLSALEVVNASRVLFASDFPANQNLSEAKGVISFAGLSLDQQQGMLGENFLRLLSA